VCVDGKVISEQMSAIRKKEKENAEARRAQRKRGGTVTQR